MAQRFSKCPTWWVRQKGMIDFLGGQSSGTSIAALKCLIAISTAIDFWTRKTQLSLSDLETLTGLSRPMVGKGIKRLVELGIVVVDNSRYINEYELTESPKDNRWAKLPFDRIRKHLPEIPNRGVVPLTALKIYLLLVAIRPNDTDTFAIGYDKLRDFLGVQRAQIRSALDILYSHTLIRIAQSDESKERHNLYTVLGL